MHVFGGGIDADVDPVPVPGDGAATAGRHRDHTVPDGVAVPEVTRGSLPPREPAPREPAPGWSATAAVARCCPPEIRHRWTAG
jgi:hypothetical protein